MARGWARGAAAVVTSLGLGGCLVVNGAFQATGSDGDSSSSGSSTVVTGGAEETGSSSGGVGSSTGASSTGSDACAGTEGDLCTAQQIGDQTYLLCEKPGTWEEGRLACEARCARLVILDEAESAAVFAALRAQMTAEDLAEEMNGEDSVSMVRASWWLGGHKVEGAYQWLDGTPMPPNGTGGWGANDPDMEDAEACVVLGVYGKGDANGEWFDRHCGEVPHRSICEPL